MTELDSHSYYEGVEITFQDFIPADFLDWLKEISEVTEVTIFNDRSVRLSLLGVSVMTLSADICNKARETAGTSPPDTAISIFNEAASLYEWVHKLRPQQRS